MPKKYKTEVVKGFIVRLVILSTILYFLLFPMLKKRQEIVEEEIYNKQLIEYNEKEDEYKHSILKKYNSSLDTVKATVSINTKRTNSANIGNEWKYEYCLNGKEIKNGDTVYIHIFGDNIFLSKITEVDPSWDDVGRCEQNITIPLDKLNSSYAFEQEVKVRENGGNRAGNTVEYSVSYKLKFIEPLIISKNDIELAPDKPSLDDVKGISIIYVIENDTTARNRTLLYFAGFIALTVVPTISRVKRNKEEYEKELEKQRIYNAEKEAFINSLGGKSIRETAGVPKNIKFNALDLPIDNNNSMYGSFTVYLNRSGTCFHRTRGCCSASIPAHLFTARKQYRACSKCCRNTGTIIIPQWYTNYIKLKGQANRFGYEELDN